jgi:hypothetical protein
LVVVIILAGSSTSNVAMAVAGSDMIDSGTNEFVGLLSDGLVPKIHIDLTVLVTIIAGGHYWKLFVRQK